MLHTLPTQAWDAIFTEATQQQSLTQLESGGIIYFPKLPFLFTEHEKQFLSPEIVDPHSKNVGYHAAQNKLWGVRQLSDEQHLQLKSMLARFSNHALGLITHLFPHYTQNLSMARTSYRPVQVSHRKTSYRKDDKRLHVDAFPSAPNQGKRILRVFCNVNPHGEDRIWRIGEPFAQVAERFVPSISKPIPGTAALLRLLKITKSYRTPYDHYMLQLHDRMKADKHYQQSAAQQEVRFPPGSTWIVQTDHVSHAAMQGQYLLEQTFSLPVHGMQHEQLSPLKVLEGMLGRVLV